MAHRLTRLALSKTAPAISLTDYEERLDRPGNVRQTSSSCPLPLRAILGAAESILSSGSFWATAHDDTFDPRELRTADPTVLEVAEALRKTASANARKVLDPFIDRYPFTAVSSLLTVYLSCFTATRDSSLHWSEYAAEGSGVCLGISILADEPYPQVGGNIGPGLMAVDYSVASWREKIGRSFRSALTLFEAFASSSVSIESKSKALRATANALSRISAFAGITAKQEAYEGEGEWRLATIFRGDPTHVRVREVRGRKIKYIVVPARAEGRLIVLNEVLLGPRLTSKTTVDVHRRLAELGYGTQGLEMPSIEIGTQ